MLDITVKNSKLVLVPTNTEELAEHNSLDDALDSAGYIGNGVILTTADQLGNLSEADTIIFDDKVYYYELYMLRSILDELKNGREVELLYLEDATEETYYNLLFGE